MSGGLGLGGHKMEKHYQIILKDTEELVYESMRQQIMDEGSPNVGAFS